MNDKGDHKDFEKKIALLNKVIEKKDAEIFQLKNILDNLPGDIYWKDIDGVWTGINMRGNESLCRMGFSFKKSDIIGKTDHELFTKETADEFRENDLEVMKKGIEITKEEVHTISSGEQIIQLSTKHPLWDSKGNIAGIVGNTVDITYLKKIEQELSNAKEQAEAAVIAMLKSEAEEKVTEAKAEHLKIENATRKAQLRAQEQFTKMANQVAHDIRSPLASLLMILQSCAEIPEKKRIDLREASTRIGDIANNLLNQYKAKDQSFDANREVREPVLLAAVLLQLITEKKFQYHDRFVRFDCQFSQAEHFVFIKVELSAFERMISNLVNNAVDACENTQGLITLKLESDNEWVKVIVQDNGKGMPPAVVNKIMNSIVVTEGKADGHGIGLTQVREALARNYGSMSINSTIGAGTQIISTFPRVTAPAWCAEEIRLKPQDIIIILDDDNSIHGAWDSRFEMILKRAPDIHIHHFKVGIDALNFINKLNDSELARVLLLTDFELLQQQLNGLDVIKQAKVERSILVTSHYANSTLHNEAIKLQFIILPKQFASEILIYVDKSVSMQKDKESVPLKKVDAVFIDDDKDFLKALVGFLSLKTIDVYNSTSQLKNNLAIYPKSTPIYLDNNLGPPDYILGVDLAAELYTYGFTNLILLSGGIFSSSELPSYLKVISKSNIAALKASLYT